MSQQPPSKKSIFVVLAIGLLLVAAVSLLLGNASWTDALKRLVLYGGAFLLLVFILQRSRRPR